MRVLIVHAHPEPASFSGAMTQSARVALRDVGHEVVVSDLYAMGFDPISDRRNFVSVQDPERFSQQVEEAHASRVDGYAPALQAEMDKLAWCTALVFQFPLWWLGMPAIMKGWIDRVFAVGRAYGGGKWFDRGWLSGKRAMCALTVGGSAEAYSHRGAYGDILPMLHPIQHGTLGFVGLTVVEPFVVFAPKRMTPEERAATLVRYRERLLELETAPTLPLLESADYDERLVRRAVAARL
jgi:NAD(P)H dehydrogenase (quinone)